jgi:2-hydroxy-3-oxopropionate reductase
MNSGPVATSTPIGFIGLGVMGRPMALNLRKAGFPLVVHSRSLPPVDALIHAGAATADAPADVARRTEVVVTMLPDTPDVERVLAGPAGVFEALRPGMIVIDMSTIAPTAVRQLADRARALGATLLDAPVSGGEIGAIEGTLSIMVGGERDALDRARPLLEAMGSSDRITYIGESGAGQIAKVCNQLVIAVTLGGVSEAFALARRSGIDVEAVRRALLGGFAASRVLDVHGRRMLDGNYRPGFRAALFDKDLRIALSTLSAYNVPAPVSAAARQLVSALIAAGQGSADYSAVATVVFQLAGLEAQADRALAKKESG